MNHLKVKDDEIVRYLLGGMSEAEQVALEEAFVSDPQIFTLVAEVENDLIDDYVRGRLELRQSELFERNFLSGPGQRQRVGVARALLPSLDQIATAGDNHSAAIDNPAKRRRFFSFLFNPQPAFRLAAGLATLLVATGGAWLLYENGRLRQELRVAQEDAARRELELGRQVTDEKEQNTRLADEITRLRSQPAPRIAPPAPQTVPAFVTLLLADVARRGQGAGDIPRLTVPPNAEQVRLVLKMEDGGYPGYRAEIQSASGAAILTRENLRPNLRQSIATFTIDVPSDKFTAGVYALTLSGVSKDGEVDILSKSSFRIEKR
jgi:hypothetical protein